MWYVVGGGGVEVGRGDTKEAGGELVCLFYHSIFWVEERTKGLLTKGSHHGLEPLLGLVEERPVEFGGKALKRCEDPSIRREV